MIKEVNSSKEHNTPKCLYMEQYIKTVQSIQSTSSVYKEIKLEINVHWTEEE